MEAKFGGFVVLAALLCFFSQHVSCYFIVTAFKEEGKRAIYTMSYAPYAYACYI